jgi:isopentenyl-diphosphate delta-isomerase
LACSISRLCLWLRVYNTIWQDRADIVAVDYILFIKADVDLDPSANEVRDTCYVTQEELKAMFQDKSLKFTPWFKLICETMLFEWWSHLDSGLEKYLGETEIRRM